MSIVDTFLKKRNSSPAGEMSFLDHIEELRWHVIRSLIAVIIAAVFMWSNIEWIFSNIILGPARNDFISYKAMCRLGHMLHVPALCMDELHIEFQNTVLSGQFMMSFSVAFMLGFIAAFPYIFWEFWRFIKPALKASELKYARGIVFWSSLLFFTGILFAYYVIAPFTINFFAGYQLSPQFKNIITMTNYYDTMSDLIMGMGIVFELPVLVFFLTRVGMLSPQIMRKQRRYAVVVIFILAAVITPPDWFSIWLVTIPLLVLYELGITISERVVKEKRKKEFYSDNI